MRGSIIKCQLTEDHLTVPLHTLKQCLNDETLARYESQSQISLKDFLFLYVSNQSEHTDYINQSEHNKLIEDIVKVYSAQVFQFYKTRDNLKEVTIPPDWDVCDEYTDKENTALSPPVQSTNIHNSDISVASPGQILKTLLKDGKQDKEGTKTKAKRKIALNTKRRQNQKRKKATKDGIKNEKKLYTVNTKKKTAYKCDKCSKIVMTHKLYVEHKCKQEPLSDNLDDANSKDKKFTCDCGDSFSSKEERNSHMKNTHANGDDTIYECQYCDASYNASSKKELQEHLCTVHGKEVSICELCDKVCSTSDELNQHTCNKGKKGAAYACSFCSKTFKCKSYWKDHEALHRGETFNCDRCDQKCASSKGLKYHKSQHEPDAYTPCEICGKMFSSHRLLKQHVATHDEPAHTCPKCNKKFKSLRNMTRHVQLSHDVQNPTNDDIILCSTCGRRYTSQSELVVHIRRFHTKELPFKCSSCDKRFVCKGDARKHERIHSNEKNFSCHQCSRKFRDSSTLCRHLHTHLSFKPFACQVCDSGFTQLTTFKKHALTHGYDKDYKEILERRIEKSSFLKYNENLAEAKPKQAQKPSVRKLPKVQKQQELNGLENAPTIRHMLTSNVLPHEIGYPSNVIKPLYLQQYPPHPSLDQHTELHKTQQQSLQHMNVGQQQQSLQHLVYNSQQHPVRSDIMTSQPPAYVPPINNDLYQQHMLGDATHNTQQHSALKPVDHMDVGGGQLVNSAMSTSAYGQHQTTHRHSNVPTTAFQVNSIDIQEDGLTLLLNAVNSFRT